MSILNMFSGMGDITGLLNDGEKLKSFLPMLGSLADTFKLPGEHSIIAMVSLEDNQIILRIVATKIENGAIIITRNVENEGQPLKFNLLDLLAEDGKKEEK